VPTVLKDPEGFWALTNRELSVLAVVEEARSAEPGNSAFFAPPQAQPCRSAIFVLARNQSGLRGPGVVRLARYDLHGSLLEPDRIALSPLC